MPRKYRYHFTVVGRGQFPFDMLRYDRCTPDSEQDSAAISSTSNGRLTRGSEVHFINLRSDLREPTNGRWESFGWRVDKVERRTV